MDDQPAEVTTPDGIIRAYGHTITLIYHFLLFLGRRNNFPSRHVRLLTSDAKGLRQGSNFTNHIKRTALLR